MAVNESDIGAILKGAASENTKDTFLSDLNEFLKTIAQLSKLRAEQQLKAGNSPVVLPNDAAANAIPVNAQPAQASMPVSVEAMPAPKSRINEARLNDAIDAVIADIEQMIANPVFSEMKVKDAIVQIKNNKSLITERIKRIINAVID
jgi:hypothetical protein